MFRLPSIQSFRLASRAVLNLSAKRSIINQQQPCFVRFFNKSASAFSAVQKELSNALKTEIEAEISLESENLGGSVSPSISGFKILTQGAEVRLTKTHENEQILVVFNVNHSVDVEDEYDNSEASPIPVALPPFSIEITKGTQRLCFHLDLVETNENQYDFRVEEFYIAPAAVDGDESVHESVYASSGKYIDPNLHDLFFVRFLEERGFSSDFCQSLVNFATHYEHSQYVNLLKNIDKFISS